MDPHAGVPEPVRERGPDQAFCRADDGIRTRDPHLGNVMGTVHPVHVVHTVQVVHGFVHTVRRVPCSPVSII